MAKPLTTTRTISPSHVLGALLTVLAFGCDTAPGTTDVAPAPAPIIEASSCSAAAAYLQACGAPGIEAFETNCTEELAEELLDMDCGDLPEGLANAGLIDIEPAAAASTPTVVGNTGSNWVGSWLACQFGFKFACPSAACQLPPGQSPPSSDDPCIEWLQYEGCGACEYYRCREAQSQCGADGYLIGYVGKYCDRFSTVTEPNVSEAAAQWLQDVRACLITTLEDETGPETSCEDIQEVGVQSHATCYVEAGFCDLSVGDWFDIVHTIDPGDVPFQQILTTGHLCLQDWTGN